MWRHSLTVNLTRRVAGSDSLTHGTLIGMSPPEHSRNHTVRPGVRLHDAVDLSGWEQRSIWGWDEGTSSFYAQLWRNGSTSEAPDVWLTGARKPYPWPGCVALEIVERTESDALAVVRALGIAHPEPTLRTPAEVGSRVLELRKQKEEGHYVGGKIHALAWTQGLAEFTPGTRTYWGKSIPTVERVDAEHHMITGSVYRGENRAFFTGADESIWWVLGR